MTTTRPSAVHTVNGIAADATPLATQAVADGAALSRRSLIKQGATVAGATIFSSLGHSGVWAAGSDAPEKKEVKIGRASCRERV